MHNFKIGDFVKRPHNNKDWGGLQYGVIAEVIGIQSNGDILLGGYDTWKHDGRCLVLAQVEDDELPPAPQSVLYNDEYPDRAAYDQTWLRTHLNQCESLITIQTGQYGQECVGIGMRITADATLQLCHDLRRMAMELKRKGK